MASVIFPSNQGSGTRAHESLSIEESTNREGLWPGVEPKSDILSVDSPHIFLYSLLKRHPSLGQRVALTYFSHPVGIRGYLAPGVFFAEMQDPALQIRDISKATGQLLLHSRRADAERGMDHQILWRVNGRCKGLHSDQLNEGPRGPPPSLQTLRLETF